MQKKLDQEKTTLLAYQLWLERECPFGSPEQDWYRAEDALRREENDEHDERNQTS
jgi:hypothetical protein